MEFEEHAPEWLAEHGSGSLECLHSLLARLWGEAVGKLWDIRGWEASHVSFRLNKCELELGGLTAVEKLEESRDI